MGLEEKNLKFKYSHKYKTFIALNIRKTLLHPDNIGEYTTGVLLLHISVYAVSRQNVSKTHNKGHMQNTRNYTEHTSTY